MSFFYTEKHSTMASKVIAWFRQIGIVLLVFVPFGIFKCMLRKKKSCKENAYKVINTTALVLASELVLLIGVLRFL